jgi:hypothetical protein
LCLRPWIEGKDADEKSGKLGHAAKIIEEVEVNRVVRGTEERGSEPVRGVDLRKKGLVERRSVASNPVLRLNCDLSTSSPSIVTPRRMREGRKER